MTHPSHYPPFSAEIISYAVWLYHVFSLSLRDVERSWLSAAFSSPTRQCDAGARNLARVQVFVRIQGVQHYLWRAVDQNGVVLDILVQPRRDANAAKRFFRRF